MRVRIEAHGAEGYTLVEMGLHWPEYRQHNLTPAEVISTAAEISPRVMRLLMQAESERPSTVTLEDVRKAAGEELGSRLGTTTEIFNLARLNAA